MSNRIDSLLHQMESRKDKTSISKIPVKTGSKIYFVAVEDIDWVEAADQYVKIHTGNSSHLVRESMSRLEEKLPADQYLRIHRSTIINVDRVKELEPFSKGDYIVKLTTGKVLRMSRSHKDRLQQLLGW